MTDYAKMSDADIAQKVWFWWADNIEHDNTLCTVRGVVMLYAKDDRWVAFDPCNNPSDAWPIIVANKINIRFGAEGYPCEAQFIQYGKESVEIYHANPLRAAMIVFLIMQDDQP